MSRRFIKAKVGCNKAIVNTDTINGIYIKPAYQHYEVIATTNNNSSYTLKDYQSQEEAEKYLLDLMLDLNL
jgi:hypothetical protein